MKRNTRTWKLLAICIAVILGVCISPSNQRSYGNTTVDIDSLCNNTKVIGKIDDTTEEIIIDCNNAIYNYFDSINIDVSYDLNNLNNHVFLYRENDVDGDVMLLGYYDSACNIYINECLLDDIDCLKFTYIHEVMHYLGFTDSETTMIMEGMADAITEDILGYYYEDSYDVPRGLCHQIIISNPDVITFILNGGDLDDSIDSRLDNLYSVPSYTLDYELDKIEYEELDDYTYDEYVKNCQEIISSYCETFDLTDDQYEEIEEYKFF